MAQDTNIVVLCGRLVGSMETKHTQSGYPIGNFTIATNRPRKNGDTWEDKASFIDCCMYGNSVTNLEAYMIKGKQVVITGYIDQDRWENDGQKFSRHKVVVTNLQLVGSKNSGNSTQGNARQEAEPAQQYAGDTPMDEDCPF